MSMSRTSCFLVPSLAAALAACAPGGELDQRSSFASASQATPSSAHVTVIHGIPGTDVNPALDISLPVDIEVVGVGCALTGFTFREISPRLALPAGSYDLNVRLSDGACGGAVAVAATGVPFAAGERATVIAHLDAAGAPTASKFTNDLSAPLGFDQGRLQVHHTAAAPAVDVRISAPHVFEELSGVTNGQSGALDFAEEGYDVAIAAAGSPTALFTQLVEIPAGQSVLVYAVGSLSSGTFTVIVDAQPLEAPATVTVVHGIPGTDVNPALDISLPVDIEVVGVGCALAGFTFGEVSGRLALPAGSYDLNVRLSDGSCGGAVAVSAAGVPFAAGENATVIAHLDAAGAPTASKFVNDLSAPVGLGRGRLQVHHTAAAPAVDVRISAPSVFEELAGVINGQSGALDFDEEGYDVAIAAAGSPTALFSQLVEIPAAQSVLVYAVGSLSSGTFTVIADIKDLEDPATVNVVHGIPGTDVDPALPIGLPVDVEVVGVGCVLTGVEFGDVSGPLGLPAGSYDLNVRLSDGACGGAVAVAAAGVPFEAGEDATVIAHLDAAGAPTASKFVNDLSRTEPHEGRFAVHHTAAAPAVDIGVETFAGRLVLQLNSVVNGQSGQEDFSRGLYVLTLAPAGGHPIDTQLAAARADELRLVYVVGSLSTGTLTYISDTRTL